MFQDFPRSSYASAYAGPRGFAWLEPGLLGGCAQPGIFAEAEMDLAALERVGTKVLVSLTEEWAPDVARIEAHGMVSIHVPIPDQGVPETEVARALCARVMDHLAAGEPVTFHCRAGKGRTGTLLAAMLIWRGMAPDEAITETRRRNPAWIESEAQLDFLRGFTPAPELAAR